MIVVSALPVVTAETPVWCGSSSMASSWSSMLVQICVASDCVTHPRPGRGRRPAPAPRTTASEHGDGACRWQTVAHGGIPCARLSRRCQHPRDGAVEMRSVFYCVAVPVMGVLLRPRSTFAALADAPRIGLGFLVVLGSGVIALLLGLLANQIDHGGIVGRVASLVLPLLFLLYWAAAALIVDAGAGPRGACRALAAVPRGERVHAYPLDRVRRALGHRGARRDGERRPVDRRLADAPAARVVSVPDDAGRACGLRRHAVRRGRPRDASRRGAPAPAHRAPRRHQPLTSRTWLRASTGRDSEP